MKPICRYRGLISASQERPVEVEIPAPINLPAQIEPVAAEIVGAVVEGANGVGKVAQV
jgi:hypothetical protein